MAKNHDLGMLCRICGGRLQRAKGRSTVYNCVNHKQELVATFQIYVTSDTDEIHSQQFCNSCYAATHRHQTAESKGLPYRHAISVFEWEEHKE